MVLRNVFTHTSNERESASESSLLTCLDTHLEMYVYQVGLAILIMTSPYLGKHIVIKQMLELFDFVFFYISRQVTMSTIETPVCL